jgi:hypothetical protein
MIMTILFFNFVNLLEAPEMGASKRELLTFSQRGENIRVRVKIRPIRSLHFVVMLIEVVMLTAVVMLVVVVILIFGACLTAPNQPDHPP